MRLFVLQHGEAVPDEVDPERPLSERGQQDMERLRDWLAARSLRVDRVLHSGKTRARQTAERVTPALLPGGACQHGPGLQPRDDPRAWIAGLAGHAGDMLLVSHMPFVEELVAGLVMGDPGGHGVRFSPGTLVILEGEPGKTWQILCVLPPALLLGD
jgi:phosphohistidine phosphatase